MHSDSDAEQEPLDVAPAMEEADSAWTWNAPRKGLRRSSGSVVLESVSGAGMGRSSLVSAPLGGVSVDLSGAPDRSPPASESGESAGSSSAESGQTESLGRDSGISGDSLQHRRLSLTPASELPSPPSQGQPPASSPEADEEWREFANLRGLSGDLRFLAGMPELCDVMFIVGEEREPVYGVKAVLGIRSRVFYKMLYGPKSTSERARGLGGSGASGAGGSSAVARRISRFFADASSSGAAIRASLSHSNLVNGHSQGHSAHAADRTIVVVEEFEAEVFKELLTFIHTGAITLRPRTLLGLMNAADHFGIEDLRKACAGFSSRVVTLSSVCSLLLTAENYIQYKSTKIFIQRVLEFVEANGEDVLSLPELVHLPRHVVELVLSREGLRAAQLTKYRAAERWARHHILEHPSLSLRELMRPLVRHIGFAGIPTAVLVREIQPLNVVPDNLLMAALAYQADPAAIDDDVYCAPPTPTSPVPLRQGPPLRHPQPHQSPHVLRSPAAHRSPQAHRSPNTLRSPVAPQRSKSQDRARLFELVGSAGDRLDRATFDPKATPLPPLPGSDRWGDSSPSPPPPPPPRPSTGSESGRSGSRSGSGGSGSVGGSVAGLGSAKSRSASLVSEGATVLLIEDAPRSASPGSPTPTGASPLPPQRYRPDFSTRM